MTIALSGLQHFQSSAQSGHKCDGLLLQLGLVVLMAPVQHERAGCVCWLCWVRQVPAAPVCSTGRALEQLLGQPFGVKVIAAPKQQGMQCVWCAAQTSWQAAACMVQCAQQQRI
jgi:hypothetical protein